MSICRFDGEALFASRKQAIQMLDPSEVHRVAVECGWSDEWATDRKGKHQKGDNSNKSGDSKQHALAATQGASSSASTTTTQSKPHAPKPPAPKPPALASTQSVPSTTPPQAPALAPTQAPPQVPALAPTQVAPVAKHPLAARAHAGPGVPLPLPGLTPLPGLPLPGLLPLPGPTGAPPQPKGVLAPPFAACAKTPTTKAPTPKAPDMAEIERLRAQERELQ